MQHKNKFQKWVEKFGGPEKLAVELNVTSFVTRYWLERKGAPKFKNVLQIVALSKGELSVEDIFFSTSPLIKKGRT